MVITIIIINIIIMVITIIIIIIIIINFVIIIIIITVVIIIMALFLSLSLSLSGALSLSSLLSLCCYHYFSWGKRKKKNEMNRRIDAWKWLILDVFTLYLELKNGTDFFNSACNFSISVFNFSMAKLKDPASRMWSVT